MSDNDARSAIAHARAELAAIASRTQMAANGIDDPDDVAPLTGDELLADYVAHLIIIATDLVDVVEAVVKDIEDS